MCGGTDGIELRAKPDPTATRWDQYRRFDLFTRRAFLPVYGWKEHALMILIAFPTFLFILSFLFLIKLRHVLLVCKVKGTTKLDLKSRSYTSSIVAISSRPCKYIQRHPYSKAVQSLVKVVYHYTTQHRYLYYRIPQFLYTYSLHVIHDVHRFGLQYG